MATTDMTRKLLCFASGRPGDWEAICLDYDIAVQGRTFEEAQSLLELSINDYVESAAKEEPEIRDRLLKRSAPARVWLQYIFSFLWHTFRRKRLSDDDTLEHSFQVSRHA